MRMRRIVAPSVAEALAAVRAEMGRDAFIFATRRLRAPGWRRFFRRFDRIEVSAAVEESRAPAPARPEPPPPAGRPLALPPRRAPDPAASDPAALRRALFGPDGLPAPIGAPEPVRVRPGERRLVALVGPTGAGKTTTAAKLAAHLHLEAGWRVALLSADTFRVGGVEQLEAYARLLGLPFEVTPTPGALERALARRTETDVVLLDTSGRGHRDRRRMGDLEAFLGAARAAVGEALEVHLVLGAPTRRAEVDAILAAYRPVAGRLLLTKLDECEAMPEALQAAAATGMPLSYCCAGQSVPQDLVLAWPDRLAAGLAAHRDGQVPAAAGGG